MTHPTTRPVTPGPALPDDSPALARRAQRVPLPLLADVAGYVPCMTDVSADTDAHAYWIQLFRDHFAMLRRGLVEQAAALSWTEAKARDRGQAAEDDFFAYLDAVTRDPAAYGRLDILSICWAREDALERAGIVDAYVVPKRDENESALALLPGLLAEQDALNPEARFAAVVRGVFAGNIFDLGAKETIAMFEKGEMDFAAVRAKLKPRPWRVDGFDALAARFPAAETSPYRCAVLFVDNAGPDVLLGMLPFARELLRRGTGVILTSNTRPSLNDITHDALVVLVEQVAESDETIADALADGRLELVPSGNDAPLIDLSAVSPELAEACERRGVDFVVLEGMGRSLESNWHAKFTCDVLKVCMIKDLGVARSIDAELYDLILKFEPA